MKTMIPGRNFVIVTALTAAMTLGSQVLAQTPPQTRLKGVIHDYTASLDAAGPWQVAGHWTLDVNTASGKVDFLAALTMARSDNATRMAHTHHIQLSDAQVTATANGYRITGTASFTLNGSLVVGFTGSPVEIEITGGADVPYANVVITFGGAAATHFGPQVRGVVTE
jgi:hypothetical protein